MGVRWEVYRPGAGVKPYELVVALLAVAVALGVLARRLAVPYPVLLVVAGFLLGIQDWTINYALPPELVLLGFLPPLLYAAAFNTNWDAFRGEFRAIVLLAVGLVLFTTGMVAWAAHDLIGMAWGPAVVLGAIVSPPDAVAAAAVAARVPLPRQVVVILEGESLVNDASALVCYTVAVAAVVSPGSVTAATVALSFLLMPTGGLVIGLGSGWLVLRLHRWLLRHDLADSKLHITLTLLTPFAVYWPAEHLHLSGVMAAVACGLYVGSQATNTFPDLLMEEARAVWETMEFVLNAVIFTMIGFQYSAIRPELKDGFQFGQLARMAVIVSLVVIAARMAWIYPGAYLPRWLDRKFCGCPHPYPPLNAVTVVGWTGMRGVVSLAAALALPPGFPDRELIQFLTFWVIFATLVGQGTTLPYLIRLLRVKQFPHLHGRAAGVSPTE